MSEFKGTPAPWIVHTNGFDIVTADDRLIAAGNRTYTSTRANARLMAAAPDLLAACVDAEQRLLEWAPFSEGHTLRAAIAKATGEVTP